ncbi:MAG: hypothetical protein ASARMPREDX12_002363 [Alectoria sarmentosa]|nr:MAG: hypothetical protein ASARMPREDX12_002363 [Alectoria sarmentosa]
MASFADLPNEILDQITPIVLPADLENFAQVCRRTYITAQLHLEAHRTMIRKFAIVGNKVVGKGGPFGELLLDDRRHPLLGHYVVNLTFRRGSSRLNDRRREQQDFERLIPLLPNLKTLAMEDVDISGSETQFWNASLTPSPILTNLVNVYVRFLKKPVLTFGITRALSALPSLRLLSTQNCGFDEPNHDPFAPVRSHLTRLELWDCRFQSKQLHDFLKGFYQLQTFKYSIPLRAEPEQGYNPFLIRSGLLYSKSTLQHLTMLAPGQPASFVGSLVEFESLQEVYISWSLLDPHWGRSDPSELCLVLPKPLRLLRIQSEGDQFASDSTRLEKCTVDGGGCAWMYSHLVESVIACKSHQTPNLSELVLLVGEHRRCLGLLFWLLCHDNLQLWKRYCMDVGVALTIR